MGRVELPSQFMENYCWEWDVLSHMTQHVETGEPPAARAVRQDAGSEEPSVQAWHFATDGFALFDMRLHAENIGADRCAAQTAWRSTG